MVYRQRVDCSVMTRSGQCHFIGAGILLLMAAGMWITAVRGGDVRIVCNAIFILINEKHVLV